MKTRFEIERINSKFAIVYEFWDDILIYKIKVYADYHGGDIIQFLRNNTVIRTPNFDGIDKYFNRFEL